jgi:hypothetical protein
MTFSDDLEYYLQLRDAMRFESGKSIPSQRELASLQKQITRFALVLNEYFPEREMTERTEEENGD